MYIYIYIYIHTYIYKTIKTLGICVIELVLFSAVSNCMWGLLL